MILLYDGYCASTCAVFSEYMKTLDGVKSIMVGGRPQNGPTQGVGGVKGAQRLFFTDILIAVQQFLQTGLSPTAQKLIDTTGFLLSETVVLRAATLDTPTFNVLNNIRIGDNSLTPL